MDKPAEIVRDTYNHLASIYDEWAESVRTEERQKYLAKIDQKLPKGSRILDVGCGNGLLNTLHLAKSFDVVGIDVSERQIAEAKRNVPGAEFICADVRDQDFELVSLDGIVSFYCFNHIPRSSYGELLGRFHRWLKTDGLLIASFGMSDTEGWTGEWLGTTTFFSSYKQQETVSLIKNNGFRIEEEAVETAPEDGVDTSFLWITARSMKL
jgi:cyclopropane fatty-acyl-phospholipid synthase-like methyltransferase